VVDGGCPRRPVVHRNGGREGGGGVRAQSAHDKGKEVEMGQVSSAGTAGQKTEGKEVDAGVEHGGDDVAAGGGSGGRGARKTGQQGRARAAADVQVTRGEGGSRRWSGSSLHSSGREVPCTGGSEEQESRGVPEEEESRGGVRGTHLEKPENLRISL
jgi:hypothetical protein